VIGRLYRTYLFELRKTLRWKFIYIALAIALAGCGLASVVPEYLYTEQNAELNGYILMGVITHYGVFPVGAVLALVFAALVVGQEYNHKTLPVFASLPVKRYEILGAKVLAALTFNAAMVILIFIVSFVLSLSLIGFAPIQFDADTSIRLADMWPHFIYAAFFTMLPLAAVSCVVMALTFITENAGFSIGIALGAGLIVSLLRFLKSGVKQLSIVEYIGNPTSLIVDVGEQIHVDWLAETRSLLIVSAVYMAVGCSLGRMWSEVGGK
jgi:ABC-type transport system involved in multi-copper enzyme maturation permease subunit